MFSIRGVRRATTVVAAATLMLGLSGSRAWAQAAAEPPDPNPGALTITGNIDFLNQYMFRGIRQHSTGVAIWPSFDLGIATYSGEGGFKSATINIGTWNSLHTGDTGQDGPSGKLWYESDFYATLGLGFGGGFSIGTTYTAYTSPNNSFSTVKEIMFKLGVDDSAQLGKFSMKPYAIFAFEFDTDEATGQADGGSRRASTSSSASPPVIPVIRGRPSPSRSSLACRSGDYYELDGEDNKFGYFSIGGIVTVPLGGTGKFGAWNLHFGGEYQKLGDTTAAFNPDDDGEPQHNQFIGSVGFGFSY